MYSNIPRCGFCIVHGVSTIVSFYQIKFVNSFKEYGKKTNNWVLLNIK